MYIYIIQIYLYMYVCIYICIYIHVHISSHHDHEPIADLPGSSRADCKGATGGGVVMFSLQG